MALPSHLAFFFLASLASLTDDYDTLMGVKIKNHPESYSWEWSFKPN